MSNEPTIEQMNEAIAGFMGYYYQASKFYPKSGERGKWFKEAKYHSSWDWLMPVVIKIEKLENGRFGFTIDPWGIDIIDYKGVYDGHGEKVIVNVNREPSESALLNDYYDAVCQFLQWFNKQSTTTNEQSTTGNDLCYT